MSGLTCRLVPVTINVIHPGASFCQKSRGENPLIIVIIYGECARKQLQLDYRYKLVPFSVFHPDDNDDDDLMDNVSPGPFLGSRRAALWLPWEEIPPTNPDSVSRDRERN